jgi:hypothetical protein
MLSFARFCLVPLGFARYLTEHARFCSVKKKASFLTVECRFFLEDAHNSLMDTKAQSTIIMHEFFMPFINRLQSVKLITQLFNTTTINDWKKQMEPAIVRPVPWVELTDDNDNNITWEPQHNDKYTGPNGGPKAGPTQYIINID